MKKYIFGDVAKFVLVSAVVIGLWYLSWRWVDDNVRSNTPWLVSNDAVRGLFGDKFGAVNSLFSALAFAGIILTVLLQRRELSLQRDELIRTREQFEEQNRTLSRQRFENTFFKLLELQSNITSKLEMLGFEGLKAHVTFQTYLINADQEFPIYRALRKLSREEIHQIKNTGIVDESRYPGLSISDVSTLLDALQTIPRAFDSFLDDDLQMHRAKIKQAYEKTAALYLDDFAHYFRSLYHILRFVNSSEDLTGEEKLRYAKILRSQLSDAELLSLFYNALLPYEIPGRPMELGYPKLGRLLVQYNILHNMNGGDVIHRTHQRIFTGSYAGVA